MAFEKPDYKAVKLLAREVLRDNMIVEPPVIAANLAKTYGLQVVRVAFNENYSHVAGFINADSMEIAVNADDSLARQNFTIAHELGHYLREHHKESGYSFLLRDPRNSAKNAMEMEANCFAANVLVPYSFLQERMDEFPYATDWQLGNLFGVSSDVIRYRKLYL